MSRETNAVASKATLSATLTNNETWTETYPTELTIGLSESNSQDGDVTYIIYRDGVSKTTGETVSLAGGTYDYILNSTGGQNYSSGSINDTLTVNQIEGNVTLYLNHTQANITIVSGNSVWLNATLITGSGGNIYLYKNGTLINNGTSTIGLVGVANTTATISIGTTSVVAGWTASGTKGIRCSFCYEA